MGIDHEVYRPTAWSTDDGSVLYEHVEDIDGFNILFQCTIEPDPEFGDMTDEDKEKLYADIEAGNLFEFCAVVTCSQMGQLLGTEYLGSCVYKSYESFHTDHRGDYYMDMVREVVGHAKDRIQSLRGFNHGDFNGTIRTNALRPAQQVEG